MKKLSILGIFIGGVLEVVATNILAMPLLMYVLFTRIDFMSMSSEELTAALLQTLKGDWVLFATQLLIGSLCSIMGGYIAAWIAKHDELLNGALSAWLCFAIGVYGVATGAGSESLLLTILGFVLSPALGLLGGYLRLLRVRAKQAKALAVAV